MPAGHPYSRPRIQHGRLRAGDRNRAFDQLQRFVDILLLKDQNRRQIVQGSKVVFVLIENLTVNINGLLRVLVPFEICNYEQDWDRAASLVGNGKQDPLQSLDLLRRQTRVGAQGLRLGDRAFTSALGQLSSATSRALSTRALSTSPSCRRVKVARMCRPGARVK